jgi:colanic acid/amylovoran biosynthesis glycosyltransferase
VSLALTSPAKAALDPHPARVAYLVSRFPLVTETFVLRELNAVSQSESLEISLFSLFRSPQPPIHDGAARWMGRLGRASSARGTWRLLRLLMTSRAPTASALGELIRRHARRPRELARAAIVALLAADLTFTLRSNGVTHVHAHFAGNPGMAAWCISQFSGISFSVTTHAYDLYRRDQLFLQPLIRDATDIVTISEYNRRFLLAQGAPGRRVTVVHCGLDLDRYEYVARTPPAEGRIKALCVAAMLPHKGHHFLLEALCDERMARVHLDLVGDGPLRTPLEEQARSLGLAERVHFHGRQAEGFVSAKLREAHVFVLPSIATPDGRVEGLPVVLMEALAAGVPTIATNLSGIPELIRDGETGLLAQPGVVEDLVAAVVECIARPEDAIARAANGRREVETAFDIRQTASAMEEILLRAPRAE